jgi:inner membrane protein yhaI
MDIIGNYKNVLTNKYAMFKGRANRSEFWLFALVNVAISIVYQILVSVLAGSTAATLIVSIIFGVIALAILVPGLALSVRRMHDIGKGGGWIFINLVPFIGGIWFLVLCIKEGEPAANRFGEPQP